MNLLKKIINKNKILTALTNNGIDISELKKIKFVSLEEFFANCVKLANLKFYNYPTFIKSNCQFIIDLSSYCPNLLSEIKEEEPYKYENLIDFVIFKNLKASISPLQEDVAERVKFANGAKSLLKDYNEELNINLK